jgi:hypothetical protein
MLFDVLEPDAQPKNNVALRNVSVGVRCVSPDLAEPIRVAIFLLEISTMR